MEDIQEKLNNLEKLIIQNTSDIQGINSKLKNLEPSKVKSSELERLTNFLNSSEWPAAVDPLLIVDANSEQDKEDRAEGILDLIIESSLKDKAFLDFGCGEGHVVKKSISQSPKISVGYDIVNSEKWTAWEAKPNMLFTTDWEQIKKQGPYNVILVYDVIDHILGSEPEIINNFKQLKSVCAPKAKVYVRCHPFSSKHATHLYRKLNKAYAHIIFTEEELKQLGYDGGIPVKKVMFPLSFYKRVFTTAGFKLISKNPQISRETINPFFQKYPLIVDRITKHWKSTDKFPTFQLELQFLDYILE
jgi:2-polyprenyl-3-methyl-5-hydroxy-6-metoxy-1,4-benzoquinol methylase